VQLILISLVVDGCVAAGAAASMPLVLWLFVPALLAHLAGAVFILVGSTRTGAAFVIVGALVFVPIGLIGVSGARAVRDELDKEQFERQEVAR
jgi:hypothetical protein